MAQSKFALVNSYLSIRLFLLVNLRSFRFKGRLTTYSFPGSGDGWQQLHLPGMRPHMIILWVDLPRVYISQVRDHLRYTVVIKELTTRGYSESWMCKQLGSKTEYLDTSFWSLFSGWVPFQADDMQLEAVCRSSLQPNFVWLIKNFYKVMLDSYVRVKLHPDQNGVFVAEFEVCFFLFCWPWKCWSRYAILQFVVNRHPTFMESINCAWHTDGWATLQSPYRHRLCLSLISVIQFCCTAYMFKSVRNNSCNLIQPTDICPTTQTWWVWAIYPSCIPILRQVCNNVLISVLHRLYLSSFTCMYQYMIWCHSAFSMMLGVFVFTFYFLFMIPFKVKRRD